MAEDPRRLFDGKDAFIAALYAKRDLNSQDVFPLLTNTLGELVIAGNISVSQATTATTISNAAGNPVPVTGNVNIATATLGTVTVQGNVNIATATLGTVTVTGTVTPSTTASTITNAAANPVNVSLTQTVVSVTFPPSMTTTAATINNAAANPVFVSLTTTAVTAKVSQNPIAPILLSSVFSFTATGSTIITAVTAVLHRVYRIIFTVSSATTVAVRAGSTSLTGWMPFGANGGMALDFDGEPWFSTGTNEALSLDTTNSTLVSGRVYYTRV